MGLEWGLYLRNKKTNERLDLISFCGWNSKTVLSQFQWMSTGKDGEFYTGIDGKQYENEDYYFVLDKSKVRDYLKQVERILEIFHGVSDRKISEMTFDDKVREKYADLCYDLDLEYDDFNINCLMRLAWFWQFWRTSDLVDNKNWDLCLFQSY
jgi:hypothetical protein